MDQDCRGAVQGAFPDIADAQALELCEAVVDGPSGFGLSGLGARARRNPARLAAAPAAKNTRREGRGTGAMTVMQRTLPAPWLAGR
jgi:hypothetical protein